MAGPGHLALAERVKFGALMLFVALWVTVRGAIALLKQIPVLGALPEFLNL